MLQPDLDHGPCDRNYTIICIQSQTSPHSNGTIHYVVFTWTLISMFLITTSSGITFIHHFSCYGPTIIRANTYHFTTPWTSCKPSSWQCYYSFVVVMILPITWRWTTPITAFAEVVEGKLSGCWGGDRWWATVYRVYTVAIDCARRATSIGWRRDWRRAIFTNVGSNVRVIVTFAIYAN